MTHAAASTRRFRVHARHLDRHHTRFVEERSFEAAAVAYLETFDLPALEGEELVVQVIVHDTGTGHEHCFRLDLETGDTKPCG
jgi:hypothetical protein